MDQLDDDCMCRCFTCEDATAETFDPHVGPVCLPCALELSEMDGAMRKLGYRFDYKPKTHDASSSYPD
jgi:hypothetical protein